MQVGRKWPGSAPGHEWKKAGDVVEVDDALGQELVAIPGGGFYEVIPDVEVAEPAADKADDSEVVEAPAVPKRRPRKAAASDTVTE